jgi:hypothetical protein
VTIFYGSRNAITGHSEQSLCYSIWGTARSWHLIVSSVPRRADSISFADLRNIVCLCRHHHGHFKLEHGRLYWELVRKRIREERWAWLKAVEADRKPYRFYLADRLKQEAWLKTKLQFLDPTYHAAVEFIE